MKTAKFITVMATSVAAGILASKGIEVWGRKGFEKAKDFFKNKLDEIKDDDTDDKSCTC